MLSASKYSHESPWPAFTETIHKDSVSKVQEKPGALKVSCGKCGNGLGHEFIGDGPKGKSRFWIFSHSLKFRAARETGAGDSKNPDTPKSWN